MATGSLFFSELPDEQLVQVTNIVSSISNVKNPLSSYPIKKPDDVHFIHLIYPPMPSDVYCDRHMTNAHNHLIELEQSLNQVMNEAKRLMEILNDDPTDQVHANVN
jgi:hypothetical protein